MDRKKLQAAVQSLLDLFGDDVPRDFSHDGQTFTERAEAWILHVLEELEQEVADFREAEAS
jgi:hypothetical protein